MDLFEYVGPGLEIILDHGLLLVVVGVVLLLLYDDTEDAVGEDGPRFVYQLCSSWRFTIEMVWFKPCCGLGYSTAGFRHGELALCCITARLQVQTVR